MVGLARCSNGTPYLCCQRRESVWLICAGLGQRLVVVAALRQCCLQNCCWGWQGCIARAVTACWRCWLYWAVSRPHGLVGGSSCYGCMQRFVAFTVAGQTVRACSWPHAAVGCWYGCCSTERAGICCGQLCCDGHLWLLGFAGAGA
jgi:hypothetical protein